MTIKRLTGLLLAVILLTLGTNYNMVQSHAAVANSITKELSIEIINDDLYCVTTIVSNDISSEIFFPNQTKATNAKSGSKTVEYKNSKGKTLWYVKVSGSYTYNGSSASCTSASVYATSNDSNWNISNKKSHKSSNTAYASATGTLKQQGITIQTINKSVSLSCSKDGKLY
ncbi:MAG: hypothetical protein K5656_07830 [Lachnospiraceae bacterium]|nr:hypothetical protein [Lachnospiraceae bacterium]